ncbi:hypothetical protein J2Z40_002617 [Cytobacillus eiseniae]|uniref:Uncharacterized protein n=1 Tax=Cytobacillus eiseniae TaxID=762947 RepID=A0ABS4RH60_9BACI|nr:hypothetical protein [Cytobacillus eiseniae]
MNIDIKYYYRIIIEEIVLKKSNYNLKITTSNLEKMLLYEGENLGQTEIGHLHTDKCKRLP